jgi:hypothetical protein
LAQFPHMLILIYLTRTVDLHRNVTLCNAKIA